MATVERAIERLRNECQHLEAERDEKIHLVEKGLRAGGGREIKRLRDDCSDRLEVINYVLNVLEAKEEEPCPD